MLKMYDTLAREKSPITPHTPGRYTIYTCGPTVYRDAHIGNLRSYLMADWMRRVLIKLGNEVVHIKNITDVGHMRQEVLEQGEDKVIAAAIAEGKTPAEIAQFYTERFLQDEKTLNILPANVFPKATDHINEMITITETLIAKNLAYEINGNVYFSVRNFPKYGQLSGNINESQLQEAVRVESDPNKRDPRDFTLWKLAEDGRSLKWPSPWGDGFPGWHIECSAMSIKYIGEKIDIHTGGVDNIFPHHEGEIAQSEGYTGEKVVGHWVHGQHLLADGVKMAKSAKNAYIISEIADRDIDPMAFRYLCMTARYRTRINFTFTSLKASEKALHRLRRIFVQSKRNAGTELPVSDTVNAWETLFLQAVCDDLDMPKALDIVWRLAESNISAGSKLQLLLSFDEVLGLGLADTQDMFILGSGISSMILERSDSRAAEAFNKADSLREEISRNGYVVNDQVAGSTVRLKDSSEIRSDKWDAISSSAEIGSLIGNKSTFDFTFGIVANGYSQDIERCVGSVNKFESITSHEIIILDNGSVDGTGEIIEDLASNSENINVIHADHVLGDGSAKNVLIKSSLGKVFVLLDPSVEFLGPVSASLAGILSDSNVGIAGYAGLRTPDLLHFHDGEGESGEMDAMQAYCFAFRRNDIEKVGLMRESFRFYRNLDLDFSFQFKNEGFKIVADQSLPIKLHEHRGWTELSDGERDELSKKNYGRFLKKWRNRSDLLIASQ
tara:strand:- start:15255 stop:17432 length:2178 start_codon:yes stop_codon:yes gene_type:complete